MPGFPAHHQLLELAQTHVYQISDAIQPSHPLLSPSPAFNLAQHRDLFQCVSSSYQVATVLDFSFNISPSNEYSGLNSFRIDWFDLLAVQHHSPKASILRLSFLYGLTLTSLHDYWKNDSLD